MSGWTALVPIKPPTGRKTRLRPHLADGQVIELTEMMLGHVVEALRQAPSIADIILLAFDPPTGWQGGWIPDQGRGLNAELATAAGRIRRRLLVIHADLPALHPSDVEAMTGSAHDGVSIAPDRQRHGTNALAAEDAGSLVFCFGPDSFARHCASHRSPLVISRDGLALDVDVIADYEAAVRLGHLPVHPGQADFQQATAGGLECGSI